MGAEVEAVAEAIEGVKLEVEFSLSGIAVVLARERSSRSSLSLSILNNC